MLSPQNRNFVWFLIIGSVAGLGALLIIFPIRDLIIVLNSVYAGSMAGIIIAYWHLIAATVAGKPPLDRARQYALGVFALWIAYSVTVIISIYTRASGIETPTYMMIAVSRYTAILAAWLQVTAPDFGDGFFASRDRRFLWIAVGISVFASIVLLVAQDRTILN